MCLQLIQCFFSFMKYVGLTSVPVMSFIHIYHARHHEFLALQTWTMFDLALKIFGSIFVAYQLNARWINYNYKIHRRNLFYDINTISNQLGDIVSICVFLLEKLLCINIYIIIYILDSSVLIEKLP